MLKRLWGLVRPFLPWISVVILLVFLIEAVHPAALWGTLRHANLWLLLPVIGCGLASLVLRSIRWHFLLQAIGAPNSVLDSIILFTAAQAALLIPGGQFLLPVLQRSQYGTLIRRSAPTILVQELVYGLLVLPAALPGVPPYHPAGWLLLIAFAFNAGTAFALLHGSFLKRILSLFKRVPILKNHIGNLTEIQEHVVVVASSHWAIWGTVFDMGAIGLAGLGLYLSLIAVGAADIGWIDSMAVYALGSAVGTLSALPGGVGANEDMSTLVLNHMGLTASVAAAGTLLFRAANLVMGTAVGWIVLALCSSRLRVHPSIDGIARAVKGAEKKTEGKQPKEEPEESLRH